MIDIIVPTRGRPQYCRDMIHSVHQTAKMAYRIYLGVDSDDPMLPEYENIQGVNIMISSPKDGAVGVTNYLVDKTDSEWVYVLCDDNLTLTDGWDEKLIAAFPPDKIAVVYPMTMEATIRQQYFCPMLSRRWLDAVGWMYLPGIKHYAADDGLWIMANELGRAYWVDDVVVAHRHFSRCPEGIPKDYLYERNEANAQADTEFHQRHKHVYLEKAEVLRGLMDVAQEDATHD